MGEQFIFEDPSELFFGLNDLARRLRSMRPEELDVCWPEIQKHIEGLIETLDSFGRPLRGQRSLTGNTYQNVVLALESLRAAHRSATEYSLRTTVEAVQQASLIMRSSGILRGGGSLDTPVRQQVE
jgi:hypothetical protein